MRSSSTLEPVTARSSTPARSDYPPYYHFGDAATNYYDLSPQNSRGFRALKVWLALQQAGRDGCLEMIAHDIRLACELSALLPRYPELAAFTQSLSITTFRFVPSDLERNDIAVAAYLDELNRELLNRLQQGGEAYVSNAVIDGKFVLRACIVNIRSTSADVAALPPRVVRIGKEVDAELRPAKLHASSGPRPSAI